MASFKDKCLKLFGTSDIYGVLGLERTATDKEIDKAYHKFSLLEHPFCVEESNKATATEKFKILGKIHSVLQNKEKRKSYDDCGEINEENESTCNWMKYWMSTLKKNEIEVTDTDLRTGDIKKASVSSKDNKDLIVEVPFSNCTSEVTILEIVGKMIHDECSRFFNNSIHKKTRRMNGYEREKIITEKNYKKAQEEEIKRIVEKCLKDFANLILNIQANKSVDTKQNFFEDAAKTLPPNKRPKPRK